MAKTTARPPCWQAVVSRRMRTEPPSAMGDLSVRWFWCYNVSLFLGFIVQNVLRMLFWMARLLLSSSNREFSFAACQRGLHIGCIQQMLHLSERGLHSDGPSPCINMTTSIFAINHSLFWWQDSLFRSFLLQAALALGWSGWHHLLVHPSG